jgi:Domain of unknown function (DUF4288)
MPVAGLNSDTIKIARWFVAEIVLEITVQDDSRNIVHKNLVLVKAGSAQEAYEKAQTLGQENEVSFQNPSGKRVDIRFLGLGKLTAVNDRLEDGAELSYEEYIGVSDERIKEWILPKHLLTVFRDVTPSPGPDYSSAEVLEQASRILRKAGGLP